MNERRAEATAEHGTTGDGLPWFQSLAMVCCLLLGLAMVVNTQMGGEAMWFWYSRLFLQGVKLYSQMHTPLQPFFVILTSSWMRMFGERLVVAQIPSVLEIMLMAVGLLLILREASGWADWQKGIVLFGSFCVVVSGHSYRFDDYHVLTENLILYVLLCLLVAARTEERGKLLGLSGLAGLLAGMAFTTRVTDGAALMVSSAVCLALMLRRWKLEACLVFAVTMTITVLVIVGMTGDGLGVYLSSTIFKAAGSKGGAGSIFLAPFLGLWNIGTVFRREAKQAFVKLVIVIAAGALVARFWRAGLRYLVPIQISLGVVLVVVASKLQRELTLKGTLISTVVMVVTLLLYVLTPVVLARMGWAVWAGRFFDRREILVALALAEWMSFSAGAAGEPLTNYYAPVAVFLLIVVVVCPFGRSAAWMRPTLVSIMGLLAISTVTEKVITPYSWQNYVLSPMFRNRVIYYHPVYGMMYIERDLLRFSEQVCRDIGADPGRTAPPMLSLPYPYPNYFCDTPPWHEYVQTFFDTATREVVEKMTRDLEQSPPQWIVYQRQLNIMTGAERLYNHGRPLAQRDLDSLIVQRVESGQWKLVDRSDYLGKMDQGGGWFILETHR